MEPNRDPPPFWSPPPSIHRRRTSSPPFISFPVLIVLLPTLALILLFFAIGPLLSLTSQLFRPSSVKKIWDSFNVFLVLFAIICGIFVRRNDDVPIAATDVGDRRGSDQRTVSFYDSARRMPDTAAVATRRLRRNSSYPDLRQESPWGTGNEVNQFRFFDDFEVNRFRSRSFANRTRGDEIEESPAEIQVIPAVSSETLSSPPPPVTQRKSRRTYQTIPKEEEEIREVSAFAKSKSPPPPPPLPPRTVIPPSPVRVRLEEKFGKSGRKKTNVKKEIAMALGLLYRKGKKKQKPTNIDDGDSRFTTEQQPPPTPPTLPPPPPSLFRGLFKKSNKSKRVHSESAPPPAPLSFCSAKKKIHMPPPPSPPPSSWLRNSTINRRPPLPARVPNSSIENEGINIGFRSPSVTIPPPLPPPPLADMESAARGDTVGSQSSETSHYGSPKPENIEPPSIKETNDRSVEENGVVGGGVAPVFCPSPDVDIKAADFIARLRDGWRLEKMNSVREKERLGQGPNQEIIMMGQGPNV